MIIVHNACGAPLAHESCGGLVYPLYCKGCKCTVRVADAHESSAIKTSHSLFYDEPRMTMAPVAPSILTLAKQAVDDRRASYGDPTEDFQRIAKLWSAVLGREIAPHEVGLCMMLLKISRAVNSKHRDNYIDIAGYADCADIVDQRE